MKRERKVERNGCRITLVGISALLLAACQTDAFQGGYEISSTPFVDTDPDKVAAAQTQCTSLRDKASLGSLEGKMVFSADDIPTPEMIAIQTVPDEHQVAAIQRLEAAERGCDSLLSKAGFQTTAMQDILKSRVSKLRYGLYKGDIPFAVYNYGVAKALKEQAQFEVQATEAYSRGSEIGRQRFINHMNQMAVQNKLRNMESQLNAFDRIYSGPTSVYAAGQYWSCSGLSGTISCY